jgi:hypothetical protein
MKKYMLLLFPLVLFALTRTFYCDHGWGYYYWLFGPIGPNQSEGMAAAGYQSVEYRGYVQFDLYAYPGSNTIINSLMLRLRNNTGGSGLQIDLNRVTSDIPDWQECGGTAPIYLTNASVNTSPETYTYFDLSGTQATDDFLSAWQSGDWFGLGMKGSRGSGEPCMHFFYAFWANEIYDAALLVDYGIVGIEEHQDPCTQDQSPRISISPNPAREILYITLSIMEESIGERSPVEIYSSAGQLVHTISLPAAYGDRFAVVWDCTDRTGRRVVPGVYFITWSAGKERLVEKLILLQ